MTDDAKQAMDLAVKLALEQAFRLGADEGARQVVKLEVEVQRLRGLVLRAGARGCESCPWCRTIDNRNYRAHSDCEAFTPEGNVR
jgi:hypothetical protein